MSSAAPVLSADQSAGAFAPPALLASLQDDLRELNAAGARQFLALAGSLQSIAGHARDIAALSHQLAELTGAGESDEAVATLQQVLTEAARVQTLSQDSREKFREILSCVEHSRPSLTRLIKLPLLLNTVGILSRIEASRLTDASVNAASLTSGVDKVAENIGRIVAQVAGEAATLTGVVSQGAQQLDAVEEKQRHQTADLISHGRNLLDSFRARSEASKAAVGKIDEQYANIHSATNSVVLSLQSEDIARQRVEHIQEALEQVSAAGSLLGSENVLFLQRSQLFTARKLLSDSLASILDSLRSLNPRLNSLTAETAALVSQTDEDGGSFAATIKEELGILSSILGPYFSSARAVASTVETILPALTAMTSAVNEVEEIQASIRLMALNAEVKAAHLGETGAAMGVLASELHKITGQSDGDSRIILGCLLGMDGVLKALASQGVTSNISFLISSEGDDVKKGIDHLVEAIVNSGRETSASLAVLQQKTEVLRHELAGACELTEQANGVIQGFDDVLEKLDQTLEQLGWKPDAPPAPEGAAANLKKLYSMHEERRVHEQAFGISPADATRPLPQPAAPGSELGENVELF